MHLNDLFLLATPFYSVFDGIVDPEPDPEPEPEPKPEPKPEPSPKPAEKPKVKLDPTTQAYVNSLLADERRKAQAKAEQLVTQLETEKNRVGTTAAEKQALEERIEALRAEYATKDELKGRETDKKIKDLESEKKRLEAERQTWKDRFEQTTKLNALTTAAAAEKAYNVDTVVTILDSKTTLREIKDEEGKPTGQFEPRVKINTKDKDGKPFVMDLDPLGAVKQLKEMPEFQNLFISPQAGGLGGGSLGRGGVGGSKAPHEMSTTEYMEWRRKQRVAK